MSFLEHYLLESILILGISLVGQWLAWWCKLPAILFLLLGGIVAGPLLGILNPDLTFGHLLYPFVSIAVAIILFEGSLTLKFSEIKGYGRTVSYLVSIGYLCTWLLSALALHFILDFSWEVSALLSAIISISGPTVIIPILRSVRPSVQVANILKWEGILIDPLGALFAVLIFLLLQSFEAAHSISGTLILILLKIAIGLIIGVGSGLVIGFALKRHWMPEYLRNFTVLATVIAVFVLGDLVLPGTGLMAVTVMGIWMANMPSVHIDEVLDFKEHISLILLSVLFVILAARVQVGTILTLEWPLLFFLLILQFVIRPLTVALCTLKSGLKWREKALLSWIMPRGVVAAATSAIFAMQLKDAHYAGVHLIVAVSFAVIIFTVIFQSATSRMFAKFLKVAEPEGKGFLIVGANEFARQVAAALHNLNYRVLLIDQDFSDIRKAQFKGLPSYCGHPVSETTDRHLDLVGMSGLLALSEEDDLNAVASLRYRYEFGSKQTYSLARQGVHHLGAQNIYKKYRGRCLFQAGIDYPKIQQLLDSGAILERVKLTDSLSFENLKTQLHQQQAIFLFSVDLKGQVQFFTQDDNLIPKSGWQVAFLAARNEKRDTLI